MDKRVYKIILALILLAVVAFGVVRFRDIRRAQISLDSQKAILNSTVKKPQIVETKTTPEPQAPKIKDLVNLAVQFTSQAPFGVWDADHEDFCEEASVVMAAYYKNGKTLSSQVSEDQMQSLQKWEMDNLPEFRSTNAQETLKMITGYFGLTGHVIYDFKIDDIKQALSAGHLVLLPAAGRELGNPNFTQPGPVYHMLVIRGYDGEFIYTNDPGTRHGDNYKYYPEIIMNAAADWPGSEQDILDGKTRQAMIVVD